MLAAVKSATTPDVLRGVVDALEKVLHAARMKANAVDAVMIGTTHFTNAVVQRRDLAPVAAVRLCLPATASLPPMVDWPEDLREVLGNHWYLAHGGNEFDGRVISRLDEAELLGIADDIKAKGIKSIAITSVFSPVSSEFEKQAGEIFAKALPRVIRTICAAMMSLRSMIERSQGSAIRFAGEPRSTRVQEEALFPGEQRWRPSPRRGMLLTDPSPASQ